MPVSGKAINIPPEVLFEIFLYLDSRTLANCARVAPYWTAQAQKALYLQIGDDSIERGKSSRSHATLLQFMRMDISKSEMLKRVEFVRSLVFNFEDDYDLLLEESDSKLLRKFNFRILKSLTIGNVWMSRYFEAPFNWLRCGKLVELQIHISSRHLYHDRAEDLSLAETLRKIPKHCPRLRKLSIYDLWHYHDILAEIISKLPFLEFFDCQTRRIGYIEREIQAGKILFEAVAKHPNLQSFRGVPLNRGWAKTCKADHLLTPRFAKVTFAGFEFGKDPRRSNGSNFAEAFKLCLSIMPTVSHLSLIVPDRCYLPIYRVLGTLQNIKSLELSGFEHAPELIMESLSRMENLECLTMRDVSRIETVPPVAPRPVSLASDIEDFITRRPKLQELTLTSLLINDTSLDSHQARALTRWTRSANGWRIINLAIGSPTDFRYTEDFDRYRVYSHQDFSYLYYPDPGRFQQHVREYSRRRREREASENQLLAFDTW